MQHLFTEPLMVLLNRLVQAGSPEHRNDPAFVLRAMAVHRRLGRAALLILAGWLAFSGAVLGFTIPPAEYKGWAGWGFLILAGSLIVGSLLIINRPGTYIWCTLFGALAIVPGILGFTFSLEHPSSSYMGTWLTVVWASALIGAPFFVLIALITAFKDPVPIRSIPARLLYLGRYGHLLALHRLATQRGWAIQEPHGWYHSVDVDGYWSGRWVEIISGVRYTTTGTDTAYYFLNISLSTRKVLWPFSLATWSPRFKAKPKKSGVLGAYRTKHGRQQEFCLWPPPMQEVQPAQLSAMQNVLEQGRPFLRGRTNIFSQSTHLLFQRKGILNLLENEGDIEQIVAWLEKIVITMENQGLSTEFQIPAPPSRINS